MRNFFAAIFAALFLLMTTAHAEDADTYFQCGKAYYLQQQYEQAEQYALKALQKYKFIMGMMGNRMDPDIETVFGKNLPALKTNISSLDFISIMCMVRSGLGISLLPRLITLDYQDDLQILDLSPAKYREIGMELRSVEDASAATLKLVEYVRNYTEKRFLPDHKDLGFVSRL